MKKKLLLISILCTVAVLCFAGCQKQNTEIKTEKDTVTVTLEENATTGFTWAYTLEPEDVLAYVKDDYVESQQDKNKLGAGGQHVFYFKAQKPGEVTLDFAYSQSWENVEPQDQKVFHLKVDDQLNVTLVK